MIISFPAADPLDKVLNFLSAFTLVMTIPQIVSIWVAHQTAGVSAWSWAAYLVAAVLWLIHGVRRRDRSIWMPCIGWILVDVAIVAGVLLYRT